MGVLLSTPEKEKVCEHFDDGQYLAYGTAAMQGWRTQMEDAHATVPRLGAGADGSKQPQAFFAVYDGHGGFEVSRFAALHLHKLLEASPKYASGDVGGALVESYIATDELMTSDEGVKELTAIHRESGRGDRPFPLSLTAAGGAQDVTSNMIGCTAVSCVVDFAKRVITCANSGDSRCVLSVAGKPVALSTDHKPELASESSRIEAAGGYIANGRVNGNLNLTRSLGDHEYKGDKALPPEKQIITCVPDITIHAIDDTTDFIVLGCDGIWDVMPNSDAVNFVRTHLLPKACLTPEELSLETLGRLAQDKDAMCDDAAAPWPGDVAKSLDELLSLTAAALVDQCLAPTTQCGIGCDNMSVCIVLFREGIFGKRVIAALNERLAKASVTKSDDAMSPATEDKQ